MATALRAVCTLLFWCVGTCQAGEPPSDSRKAEAGDPAVRPILREVGDIVLKQDERQHYWTQVVLLRLADLQTRVGDFDGAYQAIYTYGEDNGGGLRLVQLAEAVARKGDRKRAFDMVELLKPGWQYDAGVDRVQARWIEHLLASGDIDKVRTALEQMKSKRGRAEGLRALAVAYSKSGDAARGRQQFALAIDAALEEPDEFFRARALWETAAAQLAVGETAAAQETIRRLAERVEFKDPRVKVTALREAATLAARADDPQTARRLFDRAVEAEKKVDEDNKLDILRQIATAQAGVGQTNEALKTASRIAHSDKDFWQDSPREQALAALAVAQVKANDVEGAVRTATSIKYFVQYRDDALLQIIDHLTARGDLKTALQSAQKLDNPSRKATAILKVATAHAKAGDRKTAAAVAAGIELTPRKSEFFPELGVNVHFDYRSPRSWGIRYDDGLGGTNASSQISSRYAAELAGTAITFAEALGQRPEQSYAVLFNDILTAEIVQALARAHAATGNARDALAWAKQIGSSEKIKPAGGDKASWAVERRVHALLGVAEGILDRGGELPR
jgi:tetratricopeptide (TPR) repeat protein